jgi:hypothetical protein
MTISSSDPWTDLPRVSPHAGTEVRPPDALVPGVSPIWEGLGMAEPSRSKPVKHLLNFGALAEISVERPEISPALASFLLNTPID